MSSRKDRDTARALANLNAEGRAVWEMIETAYTSMDDAQRADYRLIASRVARLPQKQQRWLRKLVRAKHEQIDAIRQTASNELIMGELASWVVSRAEEATSLSDLAALTHQLRSGIDTFLDLSEAAVPQPARIALWALEKRAEELEEREAS